jgi:RNA polymerase sigma-70 factor (ECF subfamily)
VFAFVRRQGHSSDDAQDLTQGFFARLIEKGDVGDADRARGRFRSFLLASCQHFLANERDRAHALKRGGDRIPVAIDVAAAEARYQSALTNTETPERLYERQWTLTLLASVLDEVRSEYADARVFDRLRRFVVAEDDAGSHAQAANELGMSAGAVKVAVHRLRSRYREALRRRVADTVESADDVDDEIRILLGGL